MLPSLKNSITEGFRRIQESPFRNAFVLTLESDAMAQADALSDELAKSLPPRPLAGLTFVVKDNINVAGYESKVGSPKLSWSKAQSDAWVVATLKEAGAILLGKSHMNEFAAGLDGRNTHYASLKNPRYPGRLTGGSSSGSAVAVAAGLVDFAIGTDTGGSVRIPGCWNESWGLRLSTDPRQLSGVFPRSPSLDALGVLSKSLACTFKVAGQLTAPSNEVHPARLGFDPESLTQMNPGSRQRFLDTLQRLPSHVQVVPVHLQELLRSSDETTRLLKAEFYEVFGRQFTVTDTYDRVGPTVAAELASSKHSSTQTDPLRQKLFRCRDEVLCRLEPQVDFLLTPLCLDEAPEEPVTAERDDRFYTVALSLLGCPVLGIPYPGVADGCQLASLHGMTSSFETMSQAISLGTTS